MISTDYREVACITLAPAGRFGCATGAGVHGPATGVMAAILIGHVPVAEAARDKGLN